MAVNTLGFVCPADGGVPRTITGVCFEVISGGQLVFASGAADNVSSGVNSFASSDIGIAAGAVEDKFNGIALANTASGSYVGVQTRGMCIIRAAGTIVNGEGVMANGSDAVVPVAATSGANVPAMVTAAVSRKIGRAWSNATSGNYALIEINP